MSHISNNFDTRELVPQSIWETYGSNSRQFIDPRLVYLLEFVRYHFKSPVAINTWMWGGKYQERGYRAPESLTGASKSQHKFGRAADIAIKGLTSQQIYTRILDKKELFMEAGLTTLEDIRFTPTWVHMDIRWTGLDSLLIVKP